MITQLLFDDVELSPPHGRGDYAVVFCSKKVTAQLFGLCSGPGCSGNLQRSFIGQLMLLSSPITPEGHKYVKKRRRPNELASGCKTLAKQGSFAAVLLLSLHGSLESQTRNRTRVEPTGRAAEARRTASVGGNCSQSTASGNARSAPRRESVS